MKTYLGDSVYAEWDGYHIILTTENGLQTDPSNRICLDSQVIEAMDNFVVRAMKPTNQGENNDK